MSLNGLSSYTKITAKMPERILQPNNDYPLKSGFLTQKKIYEKLLLFFFKQKCLNNARVLVRRDLITEILK